MHIFVYINCPIKKLAFYFFANADNTTKNCITKIHIQKTYTKTHIQIAPEKILPSSVYMKFMAKNCNVCVVSRGRGRGQPPPMFRTIPPEGHPVKHKNTIYFEGVG